MTTLLITQPDEPIHETPQGHPERPERLQAVLKALEHVQFDDLQRETAEAADLLLEAGVHSDDYLAGLQAARPAAGLAQIDGDTWISPGSLNAVAAGLGAGLRALDAVMLGEVDNAFCAIRPPGHHAERETPMGFCLVNSIAIVARMAQKLHGVERVAIVDFDVHHGNGTQDIFQNDPSIFYASSHEMPLFPGTGAANETGVGNICNVPLESGSDGVEMREAYEMVILPRLQKFAPDLLLVSAGFDAHHRDPLANLNWTGEDFAWVTGKLLDFAGHNCGGRVVSMLEGGYDLEGLAEGARQHVSMLSHGVAAKTA